MLRPTIHTLCYPPRLGVLWAAVLAIWAVVALNYLVRLPMPEHSGRYVSPQLPDLAVIALPLQ